MALDRTCSVLTPGQVMLWPTKTYRRSVLQCARKFMSSCCITERVERVAVFWDYENCRPPPSLPGVTVAERILSVAQSFGGVTSFKAYLELSPDCLNPKGTLLHSELQSSGISIMHCPHNGKKDVADKMMLVDMMAYAIDNSAPAIIVIITGDRDFTYGVSILKLRGYKVVTVAPVAASHSSMRTCASKYYCWETVLDCSPRTPVSTCKVLTASAIKPTAMHLEGPICSVVPYTPKTLPKDSTTSRPTSTPFLHPKMLSVRESGNQNATVGSLAPHIGQSEQTPLARERFSKSTLSQKDPWISSSPDVLDGYSGAQCFSNGRCDRTVLLNAEKPEDSSGSESVHSTLGSSPVYHSYTDDFRTYKLERDVSLHDDPTSSTLQIPASSVPVLRPIWLSIPSLIHRARQDENSKPLSGIEKSCNLDGVLAANLSHDTLIDKKNLFLGECSSLLHSAFRASHQQPALLEATLTMSQDRPLASSSPSATVIVAADLPNEVLAPTSSIAFSLLIDILRRLPITNGTGKGRIQTSQVGAELRKHDPHIYERAGVAKLKDYLTLASEANVISATFDSQGCGWVELIDNSSGSGSSSRNTEKTTRVPVAVSKPAISKQKTGGQLDIGTFDVLIQCLRQFRKEGVSPAPWSKVGTDLQKRSSQPYKRAGVNRLKDYLCLAREANIVKMGGLDSNTQWVELTATLLFPSTKTDSTFTPLVQTIGLMPMQDSIHRYLWSAVGEQLLKRFPNVYKALGMSSFRAYLAKAEEAGVVSLGEGPSPRQEWVELRHRA